MWLVFCECGFQSVCPLMEKDKRFMETSWWERLTEGETGFCSDGGAMLSKSLIQFSVDGWSYVPSQIFTWGQTMVEVMKVMVTSFKWSHACTATLSAQPCSRPHWPTPMLETPAHSQASLGQSLVGSLLLSPGSWCTRFCLCSPRVYFPVLCKFWQFYGGANGDLLQEGLRLTHVCCTQGPCPCGSPLLTCTSQEMLKHSSVSVSVASLGPGVHKVCLSPLSVSGGIGLWFLMRIHPSHSLAGTSPLPLDMAYLLTAAPAPTVLMGFLWPWTWGISSGPVQGNSSQAQPQLLTLAVGISSQLLAPGPRWRSFQSHANSSTVGEGWGNRLDVQGSAKLCLLTCTQWISARVWTAVSRENQLQKRNSCPQWDEHPLMNTDEHW